MVHIKKSLGKKKERKKSQNTRCLCEISSLLYTGSIKKQDKSGSAIWAADLHPLLYTFNSTCHKPGRQLLIPESQSYLWFPLVALIKGKRKKKNPSKPSEQLGLTVYQDS